MSTKKQHYVPQMYLRNFSDSSERIFALNKKMKKIYKSNIRDICAKNNLYETKWKVAPAPQEIYILRNKTENQLAKMEERFAEVLRYLVSKCSDNADINVLILRESDKEVLACFIANLIVRNPKQMSQYMGMLDHIRDVDVMREQKEFWQKFGIIDFDSIFDLTLKQHIVTTENVKGSFSNFVKESILKMFPYIWVSYDTPFITGSYPVLHESSDCIEDSSLFEFLFLPITPKIAMVYNKQEMQGRINKINFPDSEVVDMMNQNYFKSTISEFIFSSDEKQLKKYLDEIL